MLRLLQRASLIATAVLVLNTGAAATHLAAVNKNPVPLPSKDARKQKIVIASSKADYKGDTAIFTDVVITQGETRVQADHAHGKNLDDSDNMHWTFEGNVRITGEQQGSLKSDVAVVEFKNKSIAKATATGNPAEFEQKRNDINAVAKGHAHEIVYNIADGTVRFSEDAWVWDGHNELTAHELVYNIREQRMQATAEPNGSGQVHFTIDPNARSKDN